MPDNNSGNCDVKKNWIKVRYGTLNKRLSGAPLDLDELKIFLW